MEEDQVNICRICHSEESTLQPLLRPCACNGSLKWAHEDCIVNWIKHSKTTYCGICRHHILIKTVYTCDLSKRLPIKDIISCLKRSVMITLINWLIILLLVLIGAGILYVSVLFLQRNLHESIPLLWNFFINIFDWLTSLQRICFRKNDGVESCFLTSDNLDYEIFFRSLIIFIKLFILRSSIYFLEKYSSLLQVPHIDLNRFIDDLEEIELGGLLQKIFKLDCWILLQCQISYILLYFWPKEIGQDIIALTLLLGIQQNVTLFRRITIILWGYGFIMIILLMMEPFKFVSYLRIIKKLKKNFERCITFRKLSRLASTCIGACCPYLVDFCIIPPIHGGLVILTLDLFASLPSWQFFLFDSWEFWYQGLVYKFLDALVISLMENGIIIGGWGLPGARIMGQFDPPENAVHAALEHMNFFLVVRIRLRETLFGHLKSIATSFGFFIFALVIHRFMTFTVIPQFVNNAWTQSLIAELSYPFFILTSIVITSVIKEFKKVSEQRKKKLYFKGYYVKSFLGHLEN